VLSWCLIVGLIGSAALGATYPAGVACGDAREQSAILWTFVQPTQDATVQVATDAGFAPGSITAQGPVAADAQGVIKLQVTGLTADTQYYYRFTADDASVSPVGLFRTAPPDDVAASFRFTLSGDSSFHRAPFFVLQSAAEEDADFHVWFGDTIYGDIPAAGLGVARTLQEYRAKYLQNRTDPFLQEWLGSAASWIGWDDHEVTNDYDGGEPEPGLTIDQILNGYEAFFEWMPITDEEVPGDPYRTYRSFRYGSLAEFFLIDGRQYRDGDLSSECNNEFDPFGFLLPALFRPQCVVTLLGTEQTMLGPDQLQWLLDGLSASQARFKFIINNVPMTFLGLLPYDRWDGYDYERRQILRHIDNADIRNVIILTTDLHLCLWTPDITRYLRLHQPGYLLREDVIVPEAIVGPIAMDTAEEAARAFARDQAGDVLGGEIGDELLGALQARAECRILKEIGSPFVEANRFSYLLVEVEPDAVHLTWKGIPPTTAAPTPAIVLYEATVPDRIAAGPGLPCAVVPLALTAGALMLVTAVRRARRRRA
jgi:alkaline phosphatase D